MFPDIKHPLNGPNHVEIPYYTMVAGGCRILGGIRRDYSMTLSSTVFEMMIRCWCRAITTPGERWIWSWTLWHDLKMSKPSRRWLIWGNYKFDGIQVGVCVRYHKGTQWTKILALSLIMCQTTKMELYNALSRQDRQVSHHRFMQDPNALCRSIILSFPSELFSLNFPIALTLGPHCI